MRIALAFLTLFLSLSALNAQSAVIRGNVFDADSGEPISFGTVQLLGPGSLNRGANTDVDGFFSFANLPVGDFQVIVRYVGYDSLSQTITVTQPNQIKYQRLTLQPAGIDLQTVAEDVNHLVDQAALGVVRVNGY